MPLLGQWAARQPDKPAAIFVDAGETLSFAQLDERATLAARWLVSRGLQPGDGVALLLENQPDFLVLSYGAKRAGLMVTPLSIHLQPHEVAHVLADSGARLLFYAPALATLAAALPDDVPRLTTEEARAAARTVPSAPLPQRPIGREFLYSSGTTGLPKGIRRALTPFEDRHKAEFDMSWKDFYGFDERTVYLSPAPLYHAAPNRYVQRAIDHGGTAIITRRFNAEQCLALIAEHRVTHSQWVPTMFVRLLALPGATRRAHDLSSHRCAIHAAAPCPVGVKRAMIDWWGPILREYYAGSEGIGVCCIDSADWLRKPGSVGRPAYGAVHILGDDGAALPPGEVGRIWFAGGARFAYHNAPEKTAEAYNDRGWATLHDLGHVDAEGYLYLSDRRADLILSGGVNVYPAEIEAALAGHPLVADIGVIGVADAEFGERPLAVVVPRAGLTATALLEFARARLAGPKLPRAVEFVDELPRSEAGKLLRRVLKERFRVTPPG